MAFERATACAREPPPQAMETVLATMIDEDSSVFRCTNLEMMKGIAGTGY